MKINEIKLEEINEIKIVEFVENSTNGRKLKCPYYQTTNYVKVSEEFFKSETKYIKNTKEISDVAFVEYTDVYRHINKALRWINDPYPFINWDNVFYDKTVFELYIDDNQIFDEEKTAAIIYLKELYYDLIKKYPSENGKIARKIHRTINRLIRDGEQISSNDDVIEYFRKNGIDNLRTIGKKQFEHFAEYFNFDMSFCGNKLLIQGDILVQLEWNDFEHDFCNIGTSKYKMNEIFRKSKDGLWSSASGKFTNLTDKDIDFIKFNILSHNGKFEQITK